MCLLRYINRDECLSVPFVAIVVERALNEILFGFKPKILVTVAKKLWKIRYKTPFIVEKHGILYHVFLCRYFLWRKTRIFIFEFIYANWEKQSVFLQKFTKYLVIINIQLSTWFIIVFWNITSSLCFGAKLHKNHRKLPILHNNYLALTSRMQTSWCLLILLLYKWKSICKSFHLPSHCKNK